MEKLEMSETEHTRLSRILRRVDFLAPFTMAEIEVFLPHIKLCHYIPGEYVFKKGDPGDGFYMISEGSASVVVKMGLFAIKTVAKLGPGDFFGEMALLNRERRSASVMTEEGVKLFVLETSDFDSIVQKNPRFLEEIRKIAAIRQKKSN